MQLKKILHSALALALTSGLAFAAFNLGFDGKIIPQGAAPVVSACGSGALTAGSSDAAGDVATSTTGCTITFNVPFVTRPSCVVSDYTTAAALKGAVTTTTLIITGQTASDAVGYICFAKGGG